MHPPPAQNHHNQPRESAIPPHTPPPTPNVTQADIERGLAQAGIGDGDVVLVHSSLRSFGHVAGGADAVIDALLAAVGTAGTVVVPTFTWTAFHDKTGVTFDMVNTPSATGRITEVFRHRPEAVRSCHLCHSVAAIGPHAQAVMGDGVSPWAEGSTFAQLYALDAWNLFLGVRLGSCCTALHAAEEQMRVPYRTYRDFRRSTVVWPDGRREPSRAVEFLRKPGYRNNFLKMDDILARHDVLRSATVGNATLTNVRIRHIIDIAKGYLADDIGFLLADDCRDALPPRTGS